MLKFFCALFVAALPFSVAAETYECTTKNFGRGGWVGEKYILLFDLATNRAYAADWGIYKIHEKPIRVEFERRSDTSYIFRWTVKGLESSNGGTGINSYKLTLFTSRNAFTLSGRRHGFDNHISGSGTCKKIK